MKTIKGLKRELLKPTSGVQCARLVGQIDILEEVIKVLRNSKICSKCYEELKKIISG